MSLLKTSRWTGAVLLAVAVMSCTTTKKQTLLDFACGPTKLRLEATTQDTFATIYRYVDLLLAGPKGWVHANRARTTRGYGPDSFSRLLAPSLAFRAIPFDERRPATGCPRWTVFLDPAEVTRAEYDAVSACLATNAAAIDRALVESSHPNASYSQATDFQAQLTGTVYSRLDGVSNCEGPTLGSRWDCADGKTFLKTVIGHEEGQLMLCPVTVPPAAGQSPPPDWPWIAAALSEDQFTIFLLEPRISYAIEPRWVSPGSNPKAYYATCHDRAGKTIFDTFRLAPATAVAPGEAVRRRVERLEQELAARAAEERKEPK